MNVGRRIAVADEKNVRRSTIGIVLPQAPAGEVGVELQLIGDFTERLKTPAKRTAHDLCRRPHIRLAGTIRQDQGRFIIADTERITSRRMFGKALIE